MFKTFNTHYNELETLRFLLSKDYMYICMKPQSLPVIQGMYENAIVKREAASKLGKDIITLEHPSKKLHTFARMFATKRGGK